MNLPQASLPEPRPGVIVLLSGGLDSAIMAGLAARAPDPVWPLYVRQGFIWEDEELLVVERFLGTLADSTASVHPLSVAKLDAPVAYASRWATHREADVPDFDSPDEAVFLPGRNLALLTQAAILAHSREVGRVQLGVLRANPFPDATDAFFDAFERVAREAMRWPLAVERPLAGMDKTEALALGADFDLAKTLSCIRPRGPVHCGRCNKCAERTRAFERAGVVDPTEYADS